MTSRGRLLIPFFLLAAGLIATAAATVTVAEAEQGRRQARFEQLTDSAVGAVEGRMFAQLTLLRGAAGLFSASDEVTRADFAAYVARLRLARNYPGLLGIGYAAFAPDEAALDTLVTAARRDGVPGFAHRPPGERPGYSAIVFLEPMSRQNAAALGFDMLSEPTRRAAMEASARLGTGRLSGRVRLVQDEGQSDQAGFLLYAPLYRSLLDGDAAPADFYGWVYSPLRAHDLFNAIFASHDQSALAIEIFDEQAGESRLLYRSHAVDVNAAHRLSRQIEVAGRRWVIRTSSTPSFEVSSPLLLPGIVAFGGTLISLLVFILTLQQVRAAARTERDVTTRTAELVDANARLKTEGDARTEAEAKVAQMQKIEAIGQLTGGIAHDFNNMLTVILGNLDIAQRRAADPERMARAVANAKTGAVKAAELTQRLLAFGRQQALAPRVLDPNALIAGMHDLLARTLGEAVRLETELAPGLWPVCADATQLESAILNLAINARDAMPRGGTLAIETANAAYEENDVMRPAGLDPGAYVRIALRDTGHGMSPEVAARALDPFFTTKPSGRGTGLGLSQAFGFVTQSGGHLSLASEMGAGTIVTICLPRHEGGPGEAASAREPTSLPFGGASETILVVEDEAPVRETSVETLRELGYTVLEAASGEEALALLSRNPAVSLVFTDVVMPGMNGRQLADAARALRPGLRILYTTGYARDAISHDGRLEEGVSLLQKPFSAAALALRIREELDR